MAAGTTMKSPAKLRNLTRRHRYFRPRPATSARHLAAIAALMTVIGLVSAYDTYLTVKCQDVLHESELNPLCRWIMELDEGPLTGNDRLAFFVAVKFGGGAIVVTVIPLLYCYRAHWGLSVAAAIALMQSALAVYLTFF